MEIWKDIEGYEGLYQVSNYGRVKSLERDKIGGNQFGKCIMHLKEKIMKSHNNGQGRFQIDLTNSDGTKDSPLVHVLVAKTFIPNPNGYTNIHHIDENPTNNFVENLMWMDESEHKAMHARKRFSKKVYQYTIGGELVKIWNSVSECDRNGFNKAAVAKCCNGGFFYKGKWMQCKTYKGYKWSYVPL